MPPRAQAKRAVYEQFARIGKAVASAKRLELLDLLCQGPRTVEAIADQANLSVASASQHLQVLRGARLVEADKRGLFVEYRLADRRVEAFYLALRQLAAARLLEIEDVARAYLGRSDTLEGIDADELQRRVAGREVTLIDVRPAEEYRAAHIPGALSIPLAELEARLDDLPRRREIVAYCRGPYCVMAIEAARRLRKHGFRVRRMHDGVLEWRARGWQTETGTP